MEYRIIAIKGFAFVYKPAVEGISPANFVTFLDHEYNEASSSLFYSIIPLQHRPGR